MRKLLMSLTLLAFVGLAVGCGGNEKATLPDKVPPMPKGDKIGKQPDAGGSAAER